MRDSICKILEIKKSSYYNWKNEKHTILVNLIESCFNSKEEIENWIVKNKDGKLAPIDDRLATIFNISSKNLYNWRKKKPLLFILMNQVFYHEFGSIEYFLELVHKKDEFYHPTLAKDEEDFYCQVFDIEFFRSIFNTIKIKSSKFEKYDNKTIYKNMCIYNVLFKLSNMRKNSYSVKEIVSIFIKLDSKNIFTLDEILLISEVLSQDNEKLELLCGDFFDGYIDKIIKMYINEFSYDEINILILGICFNNKKNIYIKYTKFFKLFEEREMVLFTERVCDCLENL